MKEIARIAAEAAQGDSRAFESLYRLTEKGVWFTCISLLKNEENAKDVMQNTYLTAFEKLGTLTELEGVQSWLNKVAANKCKDYLRKGYVNKEQDDAEMIESIRDVSPIPEEYALDKAKRRIVMEVIEEALSEEQYQTVILYYYAEMTMPEIADLMECHSKTVQYRLKTALVKVKEAIMQYEEKNNDRLHAIAPVPFLIWLIKAEAAEVAVPDGLDLLVLGLHEKIPEIKYGRIREPEKKKGRTRMYSAKAKMLLGACGAAAVCIVMIAAIQSGRSADEHEQEESVQVGRDMEASLKETDETNEERQNNRLTPLIRINGVEFDLFSVTIGEMMSKGGTELSTMSYTAAPYDLGDGMIEAFDGQGFSDGKERREPLDDEGIGYEVYYDTQMYVAAAADGKNVDWLNVMPLTPEGVQDFRVKGIAVTDEITQNRSFVMFCGEICLGMSKKEIDGILGEGCDIEYCQTDRMDRDRADLSDGEYEINYIENVTESHYRTSELTMVVRYDGVDENAVAYSMMLYVNGYDAEVLPAEEIADNSNIGREQEFLTQNENDDIADAEPGGQSRRMISLTEEMKNAGFGSGLIQVNNELLLQGGYMTVEEFVEKYRDIFIIKYSNGASYGSSQNCMITYDDPKYYDYRNADEYLQIYPKTENGGSDAHYCFKVNIANMTSYSESIPVEQAIVVSIRPFGFLSVAPMWSPGGFAVSEGNFAPENEGFELHCANMEYTRESLIEFLEEQGFEECPQEQQFPAKPENYGKFVVWEESIVLLAAGEPNLIGAVPVYRYTFWFDPDTGSLTNRADYVVSFVTE